jgi:hypothetical protein
MTGDAGEHSANWPDAVTPLALLYVMLEELELAMTNHPLFDADSAPLI